MWVFAETEGGLRVYDPSFQNTAVISSRITYINGSEASDIERPG